ncbi:VOC family protein [Phytoactinopolyspora alkaliphila]|uniref:VOC family protein n=1 Tax=Phytoactinopolyspora alkaliphila TaxID=1783498 RepID=A0A6N9YNL9_9ACTN|nr:VOC family protein [Phytoactinopolyspora alkaliphila]NED96574.1 VOC family protein [Phytoactinopolyspora alkaliphila]
MGAGLVRIQQVKVPVSDLQRSVTWYRSLLGLDLMREFIEEGEPTGAVLVDREAGFLIGLRRRDAVSGSPRFPGFDLFTMGLSSVEALDELAAHCDDVGIEHGELLDRGPDGTQLDIPDPDGTVIRFLSPLGDDGPAFAGVELSAAGQMTFYSTPRLSI